MSDREWDPAKIREVLNMELNPVRTESGDIVSKSPEELAVERLKANSAFAAEVLIDTMWNSDNETNRMKAANEVLNRVFGRSGDMPMSTGMDADSGLRALLDGVVSN